MSQPTTQSDKSESERPGHRYDVFLSHHSSDKQVVEGLAVRLEESNLRPFLDKWHLVPGDPWQEELEEALDNSAACAVFLGPKGLGVWQNEEMRGALDDRVRNKRFRVIPVLLPRAAPHDRKTLPRFLRRLTWVDFRAGLDDAEAFHRLVAGIKGLAPGRQSAAGLKQARQTFVMVLSGTVEEADKARVEAIAEHLRQISGDFTLTILEVEPGSIRLIVESSEDGYHQIKSRFRQGLLSNVQGLEVLGLELVEGASRVYPPESEYSENEFPYEDALAARERVLGVKFPGPTATLNYLAMIAGTGVSLDLYDDYLTPASVLTKAIFSEGEQAVADGVNVEALKRGIRAAVGTVVDEIMRLARPVKWEALAQIATVSANGDQFIGNLVAEALEKVGRDGLISVEEWNSPQTSLTLVEGLQFDRGYLSSFFVTEPDSMECVLEDPLILLSSEKIDSMGLLLPILGQVAKIDRSLLIVAEDVTGDALATLTVNRLRGILRVAAVKGPGFGTRLKGMLKDIAILTGARVVGVDRGITLASVQVTDLGSARKVIVAKESTTIVETAGGIRAIEQHVRRLRAQIEETKSDYDREVLQMRMAKLVGGVAVIRVGALSEARLKQKREQIENAIRATRAAMLEGIVPSSGVTFLCAKSALQHLQLSDGDERTGVKIVNNALEAPLFRIAEDVGEEGQAIVVKAEAIQKWIFNADVFESLVKGGAIDSAKAASAALQNAALIAMSMLAVDSRSKPIMEGTSDSAADI